MRQWKRREFLKTSAGVAAATVGPLILIKDAAAQWSNAPEKGARLRVLRWSRFVQGDIDQYMKNVQAFTDVQGKLAEQSKSITPEMWTRFLSMQPPVMKGVVGSYVEQSTHSFTQMQEQWQEQWQKQADQMLGVFGLKR